MLGSAEVTSLWEQGCHFYIVSLQKESLSLLNFKLGSANVWGWYSVGGWGKNGAVPFYSGMHIPGAKLVGIWGFFPALSMSATGFLARPLNVVNREQDGHQVKPKIWHQHDDERLGWDMHWACHRFPVRFFRILCENFPVSRLASKAAVCYSSPSTSGRVLIILKSSNSLSSSQRILSSLFLGTALARAVS